MQLGLADAVGYMDDAFAATRKIAGLSDAALVAYHRPDQYVGHYYAQTGSVGPEARSEGTAAQGGSAAPQVHLFDLNLGAGAGSGLPQAEGPFYYLWVP